MSTKAERCAHRNANVALDASVGRVVEIALRIRVLVVDRRRNKLLVDSQRADRSLKSASGAEEVTCHGLGGRHIVLLGLL